MGLAMGLGKGKRKNQPWLELGRGGVVVGAAEVRWIGVGVVVMWRS
jgi:hypothetical protein